MNRRSTRSSSPKSAPSTQPVLTPTSTASGTPQHTATSSADLDLNRILNNPKMDEAKEDKATEEAEPQQDESAVVPGIEGKASEEPAATPAKKGKDKRKCKKHSRKSKKKSQKPTDDSSSSSSSDTSSTSADSETSSSESSSEEDKKARKRKEAVKRKTLRKKAKSKKHKKSKRHESSTEESDSDSSESSSSSESSEDDVPRRRRRPLRKSRRQKELDIEESELDDDDSLDEDPVNTRLQDQLNALNILKRQIRSSQLQGGGGLSRGHRGLPEELIGQHRRKKDKGKKKKKRKPGKRATTLEYKRVDQLWDTTIHNFKLTESAEDQEDEFDQYVFTVRRKFDWENKYRFTLVDIKSKLLREALSEVMKDVKGVSLVEEQPSVDPNMLFLYLEELRIHGKKTLKARAKQEKKKKAKRKIQLQIAHCKLMISYLDEDYDETKKTLYPLLDAGNITFDLLWALFKPNTVAFTNTYGSVDDPRCFKVDYANKENSFIRGEWYRIEGRYLEYDGKNFGLGEFEVDVDSFKGPRKITSLMAYPLKYHKDPEGLKTQLIERGKRFVGMQGMNYRFHKGLAFQKKKKTVQKVNINGRIMIDPAIFRRINPNYPISLIKPKDPDVFDDDDDCSECCCDSDEDEEEGGGGDLELTSDEKEEKEHKERTKLKVVFDEKKKPHVVQVPVDEEGKELQVEKLDKLAKGEDDDGGNKTKRKSEEFTEEELLIASPVVLGFAFSDKLWLEFSLAGVNDIEWNDGAFESLVLPANQKSIVKALVSSHKFHAAETIDDVVQGKGRGLVFVLHGPPGVGKTLTAEGIAEFLRCPLYAVSAGELGTDSRILEHELQKIMDIAHSWGAVLLLDEADVFLEKREVHDIHRNALVSIFLRLLEYFQGILFLTTNRVETFDDAFQSRIHVALRYEELSTKARKEIWKVFLEKVRVMEGVETTSFKEGDFDTLSRKNVNGRQIKNAVRTAQALAVNEKEKLSMEHIMRVLEVAESFNHDLKGGTGYLDAMRSYT